MPYEVTEDIRDQACKLFRKGAKALMDGMSGERDAFQSAILYFQCALEWATPDSWPQMWLEIYRALQDARHRVETDE